MGIFRPCVEDDRLYAGELLIGLCHVTLVLKIADATHAAQDELRLLLLGEINRQTVIDRYFNPRLVGEDLSDSLFAFTDRESFFLRTVSTDTDDDLVE